MLNHLIAPAESIPQTQRERLRFIGYKAFFCGELRRADLEIRFGISAAAATRDLLAYRKLAPGNVSFDPTRVMSSLIQGFGEGPSLKLRHPILGDSVDSLSKPAMETLAALPRAIHHGKPIQIACLSLNSGSSKRKIVPFARVDNGLRWHIRAYDRYNKRFNDFVDTRITKTKVVDETPLEYEPTGSQCPMELHCRFGARSAPEPETPRSHRGQLQHGQRLVARAGPCGRCGLLASAMASRLPIGIPSGLRNTLTLYNIESALMVPSYLSHETGGF